MHAFFQIHAFMQFLHFNSTEKAALKHIYITVIFTSNKFKRHFLTENPAGDLQQATLSVAVAEISVSRPLVFLRSEQEGIKTATTCPD